MKALLIVLAVLVALALIPFGAALRYDEDGFAAAVKVGPFRVFSHPAPKKEKKKGKKGTKKKKEPDGKPKEKKGGTLDLVRAALPLVRSALSGIKRRLTVRRLELHVTWAAADPADAAIGYGQANMALGALRALAEEHFKIKESSYGCDVDFDATQPTLYAKASISLRLGQIVTLAVPLVIQFFVNTARLKADREEKTKKEA